MIGTALICESTCLMVHFIKSKCGLHFSNGNFATKARCLVSIKYTPDFKDFVGKKNAKNLINVFFIDKIMNL